MSRSLAIAIAVCRCGSVPAASVSVVDVAPYTAFGAIYFAISAGFLAFRR